MNKIYLNSQGNLLLNTAGKPIEKTSLDTYSPDPLPVTIETLQMKSGTANVPVSPYVKIVDENFKSWTVQEWHAAAVARNFDKSCAAPIGFEINAWNRHFTYYVKNKYMDAADYTPKVYYFGNLVRDPETNKVYMAKQTTSSTWVASQWEEVDEYPTKKYYDVTGTSLISNGGLRHSAWHHTMYTFANGATKTYTVGDSTVTATSTVSGDNVILSTSNSPFTWTIKKGISYVGVFETNNPRERYDALLAYTEWYRVLAAKDLGLVTSQQISDWHLESSKLTDISILDMTGTRRPEAGEDMYFYIYDYKNSQYVNLNTVSSGLLAKYNITGNAVNTGILGGDNLTSVIADSIYTAQKTNGVNMNDDVSKGTDKIILTEGSKGAQVYIHDVVVGSATEKHLFLVTPVISRANVATTADYNIPDSPALSWIQWYNSQFDSINTPYFFEPDERMLLSIKNNIPTCLNALRNYLNNVQGEMWGWPDFPDEAVWTTSRNYDFTAWYVSLRSGYVAYNGTYIMCVAVAVSA